MPRQLSQNEFIERAEFIHGEGKYDYSKSKYIDAITKLAIICRRHGVYWQTPSMHVSKAMGCLACAKEEKGMRTHKKLTQFVRSANKKHKNSYEYEEAVFVDNDTPLKIKCKKTQIVFERTPREHLNGIGCFCCNVCPTCNLWKTSGVKCFLCMKKVEIPEIIREMRKSFEPFHHNKATGKDAGLLFPDIKMNLLNHFVVIEIDADRVRKSNYETELQRLYTIMMDLGKKCIFLRVHPNCNAGVAVDKIKELMGIKLEIDCMVEHLGYE